MAKFADPLVRPQPHAPDFDAIPSELCERNQWVLWRFDWNEDQRAWAKVPYNPWTLGKARADDPTTWGGFDTAVAAFGRRTDFAGIGFMFSAQDEFCGVDFDNCVDADGELSPTASHWITRLNSYTEMSPSGTGVHVIVKARVVSGRKDQKTGIEIYDSVRYFTFTGRSWHEKPLEIVDAQAQVNDLLAEVFTPKVVPAKAPVGVVAGTTEELLEIAFRARNGDSIRRLFNGDISGHANDDSSADMALCNYLAFYSGGDPQVLDGMFRASQLMRRKWDERHSSDGQTYGQMTVAKALAGCPEFYRPSGAPVEAQKVESPIPADSIRTVDDYADELDELYQTGYVPGISPGWESLKPLYTVKPGQWTVVTGSPGSGKSVWLNALLVNLASQHGWRFAICSPEFWPVSTHIAELMALYTGQSFVPSKHRMDKQTAGQAVAWVREHFTFIEPVKHALTMNYVLSVAQEIHDRQPLNGLVLDPWTEFEQDRTGGETETDFIKRTLSAFGRVTKSNMWHSWIVAHPQKLRRDASGQYPIPTLYDIAGSAHWGNKSYAVLSLHRPDPLSSRVQIHVQKMKFRWCGRLGTTELSYDLATGRYTENSGHVQPEPTDIRF